MSLLPELDGEGGIVDPAKILFLKKKWYEFKRKKEKREREEQKKKYNRILERK